MVHLKNLHLLVTVLVCSALTGGAAESGDLPDARVSRFASLAVAAEAQQRGAVAGRDGWLFLTAELRHLGVGRFWEADAKEVSRAANHDAADPLPAILDFNTQLKQAGIELILMPVPPKRRSTATRY